MSWELDLESWRMNAFTFCWTNMFLYCFPPFRILPRVIRKVCVDGAKALIVAPQWTTQTWLPFIHRHVVAEKSYLRHPSNLIGQGELNRDKDTVDKGYRINGVPFLAHSEEI